MSAVRSVVSVVALLFVCCLGCTSDTRPSAASSQSASGGLPPCEHRPESGDVVTRNCSDIIVFVKASATDDEVAAVDHLLGSDAEVAMVSYLDHQAAQSEFSSLFSSPPRYPMPAGDLPTSFHVLLKPGTDRASERDRYLRLPGVQEVIVTG